MLFTAEKHLLALWVFRSRRIEYLIASVQNTPTFTFKKHVFLIVHLRPVAQRNGLHQVWQL